MLQSYAMYEVQACVGQIYAETKICEFPIFFKSVSCLSGILESSHGNFQKSITP